MTERDVDKTATVKDVIVLEFFWIERVFGFVVLVFLFCFFTYVIGENTRGVVCFLYVMSLVSIFVVCLELLFKKAWLKSEFLEVRTLSTRRNRVRYSDIKQVRLKRHMIGRLVVVTNDRIYRFPLSMIDVQVFAQSLLRRMDCYHNVVAVEENWWVVEATEDIDKVALTSQGKE